MSFNFNADLNYIRAVLASGVDVNKRTGGRGRTYLMIAAANGDIESIAYLLKMNADINVIDNLGRTALFYAALENKLNAVEFLLKNNASPNYTDTFGRTALVSANDKGFADIADLLIQYGAK